MARLKLKPPEATPLFETYYKITISDLNYGGHVGNDRFLSIAHEARLEFFKSHGYSELSFFDSGIIMTEAALEYKCELIHGDLIHIKVLLGDYNDLSFEFYYILIRSEKVAAIIKTGQVYFDYTKKQVVKNQAATNYFKTMDLC